MRVRPLAGLAALGAEDGTISGDVVARDYQEGAGRLDVEHDRLPGPPTEMQTLVSGPLPSKSAPCLLLTRHSAIAERPDGGGHWSLLSGIG